MSQTAMDCRNEEVFAALATLHGYAHAIRDNLPSATDAEWGEAWREAGRVLIHTHEVDHAHRLIEPRSDRCGKCGRDLRNSIHRRIEQSKPGPDGGER